MKLLNLEQGSFEWHAFRNEGIGSSDISILLGTSLSKTTINALRKEKVLGISGSNYENSLMKRGRDEEPKALLCLRQKEPDLSPQCAIHSEFDYIRCSFDAICGKKIYEIKTPDMKNLEKALNKNFPQYWIDQIQWQMMIADCNEGNLAVWDTETAHIFTFSADLEWREQALTAAKEFWDSVLEARKSGKVEDDYIEVTDFKKAARLDELRKVSSEIKELEKRALELKSEIIEGMESNFILDGVKVFSASNTTYDYKKMVADFNISLDSYKKQSKPFWKIAL